MRELIRRLAHLEPTDAPVLSVYLDMRPHGTEPALRPALMFLKERLRAIEKTLWVTLHGMVDQRSQREAAERAVQRIAGMRGVSNAIMVRAQQRDADEGQAVSTETRTAAIAPRRRMA
jgi:hypothetical protein